VALSANLINFRDKWNLMEYYICTWVISAHCTVSTHRLVVMICRRNKYAKCADFWSPKFVISCCMLVRISWWCCRRRNVPSVVDTDQLMQNCELWISYSAVTGYPNLLVCCAVSIGKFGTCEALKAAFMFH